MKTSLALGALVLSLFVGGCNVTPAQPGPAGPQGQSGQTGQTGAQGQSGQQGDQGQTRLTGDQGQTGVWRRWPEWVWAGTIGGIAGALVGMEIPEYEAKRYEGRVKDGGILLSVHSDDSSWTKRAKAVLERTGAQDIASRPPCGNA
jgi:hypothetical protein